MPAHGPSCQRWHVRARVKAWSRRRCWGAGAWGTASGEVLARLRATRSALWARRAELGRRDQRHASQHQSYLGDAELPKSIHATSDPPPRRWAGPARCCWRCLRRLCGPTSSSGRDGQRPDATLVSLAKGIELDTLMRMSQVIVPGHRCRPVTRRGGLRPEPGQ